MDTAHNIMLLGSSTLVSFNITFILLGMIITLFKRERAGDLVEDVKNEKRFSTNGSNNDNMLNKWIMQ